MGVRVPERTWARLDEAPLSAASLAALLANEIPAIRIRGFATADECAAFARAVRAAPIRHYSVSPPVGYIGMAQYEYRWDRPKGDYFADVAAANANLARVTSASFDPISRVVGRLREVHGGPVGVAVEPGLGPYYAGIVRIASGGIRLHADFAPFNSPGYAIGRIDAQIAWNFYAEQPGRGGETAVHNAPWSPDVPEGTIPPSYDLPRELVAGAPVHRFEPTAGDVVLFNTRNPHEVLGGSDDAGRDRVSIGSFVGRAPDGALVMWS